MLVECASSYQWSLKYSGVPKTSDRYARQMESTIEVVSLQISPGGVDAYEDCCGEGHMVRCRCVMDVA